MNALSDTAHVLAPPAVRVLQVVHGLPRGGLENGVVNLLNGLPRTEFQQRVACLDNRGDMADRVSPQDLSLRIYRPGATGRPLSSRPFQRIERMP